LSVIVTMPSARSMSRVSMARTILTGMGLNPFRQQQRRTGDYVLVAATLVVVLALVVWAFLG
jgi:hypothetical protein